MGLEPIWISPFDFKSNAYTNSAIRAYPIIITQISEIPDYYTKISASIYRAEKLSYFDFFTVVLAVLLVDLVLAFAAFRSFLIAWAAFLVSALTVPAALFVLFLFGNCYDSQTKAL